MVPEEKEEPIEHPEQPQPKKQVEQEDGQHRYPKNCTNQVWN